MNDGRIKMKKIFLGLVILLGAFLVIFVGRPALAQGDKAAGPKIGVAGFVDEDGDGFNDLLPDSDGDGVPDAIDPDSKGHHADSLFMHQQIHGRQDSVHWGQHTMGDSSHLGMHGDHRMFGPGEYGPGEHGPFHGEPGQYGPGDSSMHGGMCPDDSMGGHHHGGMDGGGPWPDSGGMGGDGGMGPGPGKNGNKPNEGSKLIDKGSQNIIEGQSPYINTKGSREENKEKGR